jgi:hypothetical protein
VQDASDWLHRRVSRNLQYGKLARSNQKNGGKHEPNANSKQCQGGEQKTAENEQSIPPAHCGYWLAKLGIVDKT